MSGYVAFALAAEFPVEVEHVTEQKADIVANRTRRDFARLNVAHAADESAAWLTEHGACFVTLSQYGELRGA